MVIKERACVQFCGRVVTGSVCLCPIGRKLPTGSSGVLVVVSARDGVSLRAQPRSYFSVYPIDDPARPRGFEPRNLMILQQLCVALHTHHDSHDASSFFLFLQGKVTMTSRSGRSAALFRVGVGLIFRHFQCHEVFPTPELKPSRRAGATRGSEPPAINGIA